MNIDDAQHDLRRAYVGGGPGVVMSGLVWLAAAFVERRHGIGTAFLVLFFGGWLIFPGATLLARFGFRRARESKDNPFGRLALESTVAMIAGLFAAWLFLPFRPEWVFPLSALAVGTHYAVFRTVYGDTLFYVLGGLITLIGFAVIFGTLPVPGGPVLAVGLVEVVFGLLLTTRALRAS